jgi:cyclophilin family peptidyl-prolyl cis-trans isomerase
MRRATLALIAVLMIAPLAAGTAAQGAASRPAADPMMIIETAKGVIEVQLFPNDAPKTVEHIVALAKRNFYNGQRVHRAVKGFVVQFGDPQTRDMTRRPLWGSQGSGRAIGVAEVKRKHTLGAVAVAHIENDPKGADSQMYITLSPQPKLDRDYTVFGQVVSGMAVAQKLVVTDVIRRVTVKP